MTTSEVLYITIVKKSSKFDKKIEKNIFLWYNFFGMNISIVKRLRKLKDVLNISLTEISSEIGLSQSYLSEIFWGKASPNFDFFYQMGKKYRVSSDWILHGDGNMFLDKAPVDPEEKFNAEKEILKDLLTEFLSDDGLLNQALFKMKVKKR